ncbi:ribonuclease H-like domain-containing protein [Phycomyces nitens]|nr:ribonuclease H-like domain-containing protein [Phycomyces nitens]
MNQLSNCQSNKTRLALSISHVMNRAQESKTKPPLYDYYLFFDVEATCEANGGFEFPNEIIEFPVVLVDAHTFEIVDEYRSYVKPTINPILTKFCLELTGIDQATVDRSPCFIDVLDDFQEFLAKWSLFQKKSAVFVTDGPFDIRDFITKQCKHSNLKKRPDYFCTPWINIRKLFREFYKYPVNKNIGAMLEALDMKFKGREHSGLDDSRNLVAIGRRMWEDGCVFKTNAKMRVVQKNHRKR